MKVVSSVDEIRALSLEYRSKGLKVSLVPTMGWFHSGHVALMMEAGKRADKVIVSLFINPIQFGPDEDFDNYPYDLKRDCKLAEEAGVDVLYAPDQECMYPKGFASTVHVEGLTSGLCGGDRPGHFDGVTTVVSKLFNQTLPHVALFGEKDYQQLAVIRKLVRDLDFPVEIIGHPIVRDEDGLALSSRNNYLKDSEREAALSLSRALASARELADINKNVSVQVVKNTVTKLINRYSECKVNYIEIVDKNSLQNCTDVNSNSMLLLAVTINNRIRLIDNSMVKGG